MDQNQNVNHNAEDSIEFGDGVELVPPPAAEDDPFLTEDEPIVSHKKESTLELDSPLLNAIEEINGETEKKKQHNGAAIAGICIVLIAVAAIGLYFFFGRDGVSDADQNNAVVEEDTGARRSDRAIHHVNYEVVPDFSEVLINGVALKSYHVGRDGSDGIPLVGDQENMVTFSVLGYVPQSQFLESDFAEQNTDVTAELVNDEIYQHSKVTIKLPKNVNPDNAFVYINGQMRNAESEMRVDCVSGFPYYIQLQQEGFGDHLHVIWPTRSEETVELPDLVAAGNAAKSTIFNLDVPKEYQADRSFSLNVTAEGKTTSASGRRILPKDELIRISMKKDGRFPMSMILDTTPFGSITVKPYMALSSLGEAKVKFSKGSDPDITLCMRRVSEAVCMDPEIENSLSSGKWELVAYKIVDDEKHWFVNAPYETFTSDATYTIMLSEKDNSFVYDIAKQAPPKKKKK